MWLETIKWPTNTFIYFSSMVDGTEGTDRTITAGGVTSLVVTTDVTNRNDLAYLATITIRAPTRLLEIGRLSGSLNNVKQF